MIIDRLLAGAVKIWLNSQLQVIKGLKVVIAGKDRQIMTGYIPEIVIIADTVTYQDICLSKVKIKGINIRFNLNEIIKAKPFQLLEAISVKAELLLKESDVQASLSSALFSSGLTDFWHKLLQADTQIIAEDFKGYAISWQEIMLDSEKLKLTGNIPENNSKITIISGLTLSNPQTLLFAPITISGIPDLAAADIPRFELHLGDDIDITKLSLGLNQLILMGEIMVYP